MVNFKESLTELNITKQRKFVLGGGGIMNYANLKVFFVENLHVIIGYIRLYIQIYTVNIRMNTHKRVIYISFIFNDILY